jgi:hypothetical protein
MAAADRWTPRLSRPALSPSPRRASTPTPETPAKQRRAAKSLRTLHDETAHTALMTCMAPTGRDVLMVDYSGEWPVIELSHEGETLLSGTWAFSLSADDEPVPFTGAWDWCCFHTDSDGDYLELEATGMEGWRIERQLFLGRNCHRLLMAETVCAPEGVGEVLVESWLPLAPGVRSAFGLDTREGKLMRGKSSRPVARLFPLALDQDRVQKAWGACERIDAEEENDLPEGAAFSLHGSGRGLYSPLVIDWHPDRRKSPARWRTLTCTQEGRKLAPFEAAGHRLQVGDEQWLVYRQIERSEVGRAVLGYHTRYESVVGRVQPAGTIKELLQIE